MLLKTDNSKDIFQAGLLNISTKYGACNKVPFFLEQIKFKIFFILVYFLLTGIFHCCLTHKNLQFIL